ncbi:hypothetical protein YC2023_123918 [Brassica napus]
MFGISSFWILNISGSIIYAVRFGKKSSKICSIELRLSRWIEEIFGLNHFDQSYEYMENNGSSKSKMKSEKVNPEFVTQRHQTKTIMPK